MDSRPGDASFMGTVKKFSHMWLKKRRYGAATAQRGQTAQYAYIDHRVPVCIQHIFQAVQHQSNGADLIAEFAVIQRFQGGDELPNFPWEMW